MDDDTDLNDDTALNREMAAGLVPVLREIQTSFTGFAVDLAKWIMTSLLAINGAGVLAVWPSSIPIVDKVAACVIFVAGMMSAMLSGYFGLKYINRVGRPLGEMIGYWISVQADGIRVAESEDFDCIEKVGGTWPSTLTGWLAAILFVVGAAVAGWGGYTQLPAKQAGPATSEVSEGGGSRA